MSQDEVTKLKHDACLVQDAEELEGIVRTGTHGSLSAAFQSHYYGLDKQEVLPDRSCYLRLVWDRGNVNSLGEFQVQHTKEGTEGSRGWLQPEEI